MSEKIRIFTYEIGFYLFLVILGYFINHYFTLRNFGNEFNERLVRAEESISRLHTQGMIQKSLEGMKPIKK